jgi:hypothetical protein
MREKVFRGRRTPAGCVVTYNGARLSPRLGVRNHSPDGFEWGYHGSGPAQLALAILCKAAGESTARQLYQEFKRKVVGLIRADEWVMSVDVVREWVADALIAEAARGAAAGLPYEVDAPEYPDDRSPAGAEEATP